MTTKNFGLVCVDFRDNALLGSRPPTINWTAIGPTSIERARAFRQDLDDAIAAAEKNWAERERKS